jgi:hypothetical protein
MESIYSDGIVLFLWFLGYYPWALPVIVFLAVWELVWKFIALWKAAGNNHLGWFICIAIFNTVGILPIIYLLTYKKEGNILKNE